jgi:Tol biopolymer transport system component
LIATYQQNTTPYARSQIAVVSEPAGQLRPVTRDTNNYQTLTLSADGKTLATVQQRSTQTFYALPAEGFKGDPPNPAPAQIADSLFFDWSGNDTLYFDNGTSLVRISADGRDKTNLLNDSLAQFIQPVSCQDGRYIVFTWAGRSGGDKSSLWRVNADGTNPTQLTDGQQDIEPECSRDGKRVFYDDVQDLQVKQVSIDGGKPEVVPDSVIPNGFFHYGLTVSPDGKSLAFLTVDTKASPLHRIVLVPLDAGSAAHQRILFPDPRVSNAPRFTPDGNALVYPILENGTENLWLQPLDGTPGRQITNFKSDGISSFRFSPDGKTLGVLRSKIASDVVLLRDAAAPRD